MWMNPEDLELSKINQAQNHKYCMISLMWGTLKADLLEVESKRVGDGEKLVNRYRVTVRRNKF